MADNTTLPGTGAIIAAEEDRPAEVSDVPFFGPRQGECAFCKRQLGAYWSKWIERTTGSIGCDEHNIMPSPYERDWDYYSDG